MKGMERYGEVTEKDRKGNGRRGDKMRREVRRGEGRRVKER